MFESVRQSAACHGPWHSMPCSICSIFFYACLVLVVVLVGERIIVPRCWRRVVSCRVLSCPSWGSYSSQTVLCCAVWAECAVQHQAMPPVPSHLCATFVCAVSSIYLIHLCYPLYIACLNRTRMRLRTSHIPHCAQAHIAVQSLSRARGPASHVSDRSANDA